MIISPQLKRVILYIAIALVFLVYMQTIFKAIISKSTSETFIVIFAFILAVAAFLGLLVWVAEIIVKVLIYATQIIRNTFASGENLFQNAIEPFRDYASGLGKIRQFLIVFGWVVIIVGFMVNICKYFEPQNLGNAVWYCWFIFDLIYSIKINFILEVCIFCFLATLLTLSYKLTIPDHPFYKLPIKEIYPVIVARVWANYLMFCSLRFVAILIGAPLWFLYMLTFGSRY